MLRGQLIVLLFLLPLFIYAEKGSKSSDYESSATSSLVRSMSRKP